jgi:hypothetical protein
MKFLFPIICFFAVVAPLHAFNPITVEPDQPYEVNMIEGDPYITREYLGSLEDYPEMYELTTDVAIDIAVKVRQRDSNKAVPYGLIIVRQNDDNGGVTEIGRLNQPLEEWKEVSHRPFGMGFLESQTFTINIKPGTYRIEVSTPDNRGSYMLVVGDEPAPAGFFGTIADAYVVQRHFGYWPFHIFFSSYIYYSLGSLLIMYGMYRTYRYKTKRHA